MLDLLPLSTCKRNWKRSAMVKSLMISMSVGNHCTNSLWAGILTSMMGCGSTFDHLSPPGYYVVDLLSIGIKIAVRIPMAASASTTLTILLLGNVKQDR